MSPILGDPLFSHTGIKHSYYSCIKRQKQKACDKRPIGQKWIEDQVLKATQTLLADDIFLDCIADKTFEYYQSVQSSQNQREALEKELHDIDVAIDQLVCSIEAGAYTPRIKQRFDELNAQKAKIKASIADLPLSFGLKLTRDHILFFIRKFRDADPSDCNCQKQLIQTFVNAVFVYDDEIKIVYNYTADSNTITLDTVESLDTEDDFEF